MVFSEDEIPTTSDVGVMLSQYLNSMRRFQKSHTFYNSVKGAHLWRTSDGEVIRVAREET